MSLSRKAFVLLAGVSVALGACTPAASQSPSASAASASATSAASEEPSGSADASAGRLTTSVLRVISSENELPSSWVSRLRPAVRDR